MKFLRAFVKLLKGLKQSEESSSVNSILRDIGRNFSDLRDAHVRRLMLFELMNQAKNDLYLPVLEQLDKQNQMEIKSVEYSMVVEENEFLSLKQVWSVNNIIDPYFDLKNPESQKILEVFASSYVKSSSAFNSSIESSDPNLLHEWRKRLKDVQYQYELLYDNLNSEIQNQYQKIQDLCNSLGELNDLDMMNRWIANNQIKLADSGNLISMLSQEISKNQEDLLNDSRVIGDELYAFTPEHFKNQLF